MLLTASDLSPEIHCRCNIFNPLQHDEIPCDFIMPRTDKPSGGDVYFGFPVVMLIATFLVVHRSFKAFFPSVLNERIVVAKLKEKSVCLDVYFEVL